MDGCLPCSAQTNKGADNKGNQKLKRRLMDVDSILKINAVFVINFTTV